VRIEAARVLATVPAELFDAPQRRAFDAALAELKDAQQAMADMPSAQLNLAGVYEDLGERDLAERGYQAALRMDPDFFPGRINLARLYDAMRRTADAERTLREGITRAPAQGELHYALGLLLADTGRLPEAADVLREAARLLPGRARVRYNYGVMLQQLGRDRDAEAAWLEAHRLDRDDTGIAYALAVLYLQQRRFGRAMTYARLFADLTAQDPRGRELIAQIEQVRARTERR
jgi:tetratricopeptide (TPR) repeat protein